MRFYDIAGGSAQLDGQDLSVLNVNNLRRHIGYVSQLPILFNGTVRYNILLGKPDANENDIINAAKAASAHDFIMNLPQVSIQLPIILLCISKDIRLISITIFRAMIPKSVQEEEC